MEIFKTIGTIIVAVLGAGGLGAYFVYKGNQPKTIAEAEKIHADTVTSFAEGWEKYAINLEKRMLLMEEKYEKKIRELDEKSTKRIKDLEDLIEAKDEANALIVLDKDSRINTLEKRIDDLEDELLKYQTADRNVEVAKEILHESVEDNLNNLKQ